MEVTRVLVDVVARFDNGHGKGVLAYCILTLDDELVVKDVKVVRTREGTLLVSMPTRKVADRCVCGDKNQLAARYCNWCGMRLGDGRGIRNGEGKVVLYVDVAHPVSAAAREKLERAVIGAYEEAITQARIEARVD